MLEKLKRRLSGETFTDDLLLDLLNDAEFMILNYIGRDFLPKALEGAQVMLAAVLFSRLGMEGETRHNEGGIVRSADGLPEEILMQIRPYRLVRTVAK